MRIGFINLYEQLNPLLFTSRNAPIGDDLLLPFNRIGELARSRGHECIGFTKDVKLDSLDALVCIDYPRTVPAYWIGFGRKIVDLPKYLITMENGIIHPMNFDLSLHKPFRKVFTWSDDLVDADTTGKYVKINYAQKFFPLQWTAGEPEHLLCAMSANKHSSDPRSLYPRRQDLYRILDGHPEFHLYGPGWEGYKSWKGTVPPGMKRKTLSNYRFCICFENASFNGYITEKIFDCFIAGCIPFYLGAPNVNRWIPGKCYEDARFTHGAAGIYFDYLKSLDQHAMLEAIYEFMRNDYQSKPFRIDTFATTILDGIGAT